MGIEAETRAAIVHAFLDALDRESQSVEYQLAQVADLLPEPDVWTTDGHEDATRLLLLTGEALFTLTVEGEEVVANSHRPRVTHVKHRRSGRRTLWEFGIRDRDALTIEGRMDPPSTAGQSETFDQPEAFARALAACAGWSAE